MNVVSTEIEGVYIIEPQVFGDELGLLAVRPHYSVLDKSKLKQTFGLSIPYWKDSLKVCLSKING